MGTKDNKTKEHTESKKKGVIIAAIIAIVALSLLLYILLVVDKSTPYISKYKLEIQSAKNIYSNHVFTYTTDTEGKDLDVGLQFEDTSASFKFYDYTISEPDEDGNTIISFKYDTTVPIKFTRENHTYKDKYYYTYSIVRPILFDKYTGEEYQKYTARSDSDEEKWFKYNEFTWNGNAYKIGVRTETTSVWDGKKQESKDIYIDTNKVTTIVYISVPKEYDGIMIAILKEGTASYYQKNQDDEPRALLSYDGKSYSPNDFYVFPISDIEPTK